MKYNDGLDGWNDGCPRCGSDNIHFSQEGGAVCVGCKLVAVPVDVKDDYPVNLPLREYEG